MPRTWREDVVNALHSIGGTGSLSQIYEAISEIRPQPLPKSWQSTVRKELEHNSSDTSSYKGKFDLFYSVQGLGNGIWGLRANLIETEDAIDLFVQGNQIPERKFTKVFRVLRDTIMTLHIKAIYDHECQICGEFIKLSCGKRYSEAHHIIPLGSDHNGPDIAANIIVLCPNHHVQCDYGAILLEADKIKCKAGHYIDPASIDYHNSVIYKLNTRGNI